MQLPLTPGIAFGLNFVVQPWFHSASRWSGPETAEIFGRGKKWL